MEKNLQCKKVDFIERVAKSYLGLYGLQIVVFADKMSSKNVDEGNIEFAKIGKKCLDEINGEYISKKYNIEPSEKFGKILHQERVKWMEENS